MASEFPFHIQTQPLGYQEKLAPDLINEEQTWLCRGSQNTLIAPDGTVQSRKGLTVVGDTGDATSLPIAWANTWTTRNGIERPLRTRLNELQVLYKDVWRTFYTGFGSKTIFDSDTWYNKPELKDQYLFVNGSNFIYSWLGGITEAYSATTTTLTKKFIAGPSTGGNNFVFNAAARTITASWANFVNLGFQVGDIINVVSNSSPNVGQYELSAVTATVLTLSPGEVIVNETNTGAVAAPTANASLWNKGGNLAASTTYYYRVSAVDGFGGETLASTEVSATTTTTKKQLFIQWTAVAGAVSYNVYRSTSAGVYTTPAKIVTLGGLSFIDEGTLTIQDGTVPGAATTGMYVAVYGRETWNTEQFGTVGDMAFLYNGVKYSYTGGFNTPTLTGITPNLPAVTLGDIIYASVEQKGISGGDVPGAANYDIIMVSENQVWIASSQGRQVFVSKNSDFRNYAYTVPVRIPGDGGSVTLDSSIRSIDVSDEGEVHITAGKKDIYKLWLESTTSGSTAGEEIRVRKIKNSSGQAAVNHRSVTNTKNGLMYYSNQPSIDYLARVEQINTQQGLPVSDPIYNLLQRLDFTNADSEFHQDNAFFLLPVEGVLLMYDTERDLWQPPQIIGGAALSIINNRLVIHSSVNSNSYYAFSGSTDFGNPISAQAVYSYRNGGYRAGYKTADKYFIEARINQSTTQLIATVDLGYNGSVSSPSETLSSLDGPPYVEEVNDFSGIGVDSIGSSPIGGFYANPDEDSELGTLSKVRRMIALPTLGTEFFEIRFRVACEESGAHFQVLAHGDNMIQSDSVMSNLIKSE